MGLQARKKAGAGAKPGTKPAKRKADEPRKSSWVVAAMVALTVVAIAGLWAVAFLSDPVPHAEPATGGNGGKKQPEIRSKNDATKAAQLAAAAAAEEAARRPPTAEEYSSCFTEMHLDQANRVDLVYWPGCADPHPTPPPPHTPHAPPLVPPPLLGPWLCCLESRCQQRARIHSSPGTAITARSELLIIPTQSTHAAATATTPGFISAASRTPRARSRPV